MTLADAVHGSIGSALDNLGGYLRCSSCGATMGLYRGDAGGYTAHGWPMCCGRTMTWWTQRQIDAGEAPPLWP